MFLEFRAENDQFRPEAVRFTWMRAGAELVNARLPQDGVFTSTGPVLGSIFIETDGPLVEPRLLAVKGMRGDTEAFTGQLVSGAVAVVPASADPVQRWAVRLEEPLADQNGDGKPDVVQRDCLRAGWRTCLEGLGGPSPGGPPNDGGDPQPIADGGAPADTAAPADTGPVSVDSGLIGHWRLDEGSGTLARDSSGQSNHGSLRGPAEQRLDAGQERDRAGDPQRRGRRCVRPRVDERRQPAIGLHRGRLDLPYGHRQGYATVLSRRYQTGGSEHYLLAFQNGTLKALVNSYLPDGEEGTLAAPDQSPLYTWVHVALSYDGTTLRLYQDGRAVGSLPYALPLMPDSTPICFGCNQNGPGDSANDETLAGRLDEVLLYNRALTTAEISGLAAGTLSPGM